MTNFFKSLEIDAWYMVFVYLGGLLLIFSIFLPTQWVTNNLFYFLLGYCLLVLANGKITKTVLGLNHQMHTLVQQLLLKQKVELLI